MKNTPFCNTELLFCNKSEMEQKLLSLDAKNIVLLLSESSAERWNMLSFVNQIKDKCKGLNGKFNWISSISANPTQKNIIESLQIIGESNIELIIAIGGGSCMDLAKGISAFHNSLKEKYSVDYMTESIKKKTYKDYELIDIIAIPSTAGTGSEVTQWATIWDEKMKEKFSIDDPRLKPGMAVIVPELTISVSARMTLSTGLDAMCQAIESFWSKHTTPIVQEIAYRAIELIIKNLRNAVDNPDNIIVRENLCKASVLAGLAFSQTRTTACHSISYPLTMRYGIPHGIAASITLEAVGRINKGHFINDDELFHLFDKYGGIMNWIKLTCDGIIDMRLSVFGMTEKDVSNIADDAFTSGRMDNNPVNLSKEDVVEILKSVL